MDEVVGGRYRLDEPIGSGGMAEVWRATDLHTGATVALKRLHPGLGADGAARARFQREVDAARAVAHAAAVRVLDAGVDDEVPWLVMEHVGGGSLSERVREGALGSRDVARIGADIASALGALHAAGIVHRDVTPSNILLPVGGGARLGDFGIARTWDGSGVDDITVTGDLVGTLRFVAPEVLAGEPAGPASDVWALGAVLYEAVTGRRPFDASSPAALLDAQRTVPPLDGIDPELATLLRPMLDPEPLERPAASAVAASLARAASGVDDDRTDTIPDEGTVVVADALPSRAAGATHPVAIAPSLPDLSPRPPVATRHGRATGGPLAQAPVTGRRPVARPGRVPAPAILAVGLLLLAGVVLGASALDRPAADGPEPSAPTVTADPTPEPTPEPTGAPADDAGTGDVRGDGNDKDKEDDKGRGNGGGNGRGNGNGNGD